MKQNKYDEDSFFRKCSQMDRSVKGLAGAGEWKTLERMLPDFHGKRVLDLGCGFGWHCPVCGGTRSDFRHGGGYFGKNARQSRKHGKDGYHQLHLHAHGGH